MDLGHMIVSEESVQRYVTHASDRCVQDLLSASRPELCDDWKLYKIKRGVEISRRSQGPVMVVRGRSFINVPPSELQSLASAIETAKQWDPYFVEGEHLRNVQENLDLLRLVFSSGAGPLFRNREFIVYERRETMDDGTQVIAVSSLPRELASGLYPEEGRLVRGLLLQSGWVIEQVEQSDACIVTYVAQACTKLEMIGNHKWHCLEFSPRSVTTMQSMFSPALTYLKNLPKAMVVLVGSDQLDYVQADEEDNVFQSTW